jgi:nitrous oxidase accessory protein NosD
MRVKKTFLAAALAGLTTMLLSGPAAADVIRVSPGESIQAAIDQAGEGDTVKLAPGTYTENVQIKTDGITLKGAGADETVIEPGSSPSPVDPFCEGTGICVADVTLPADPNAPPIINNHVAGVRIKDLAVKNFKQFSGVFFFGARDQRVSGVLAENGGEYGIGAFNTTGGQYWGNVTTNNGEAGIYVGDSPDADAVVRHNVSSGNLGFGIFVRDAAHGVVEDNDSFGNCIGILFLDTPAPTDVSDWTARDNDASHNTAVCPTEEGGPPVGGIGIAIANASGITLVGNTANENVPAGPVEVSGGIVVVSPPPEGPGDPVQIATDNTIKLNTAFGNSRVDLLWDQQGDNRFIGNRCRTSDPDGLCVERRHGHGHGRRGDDGDDGDHGHSGHHGDKHGKHNHKHHKQHKHHKHHDD